MGDVADIDKKREDVSKENMYNIGSTSIHIILAFQQENERTLHIISMFHDIFSAKQESTINYTMLKEKSLISIYVCLANWQYNIYRS